jgi:hypothetical protein
MLSVSRLRRTIVATAGSSLLVLVAASSVLGHSQIVQPPSHDEPVVIGPISNAWAQAHCNSAAPAIVANASDGVVRFLPGAALPCPAIANPGGQIHP